MYAIVETGGKQYKVAPGDVIKVEKLPQEVGQEVTLDQVLLAPEKKEYGWGRRSWKEPW